MKPGDSEFLLYPNHKRFLSGKCRKLVDKREAFENLCHCVGVPGMTKNRFASGCASYHLMGLGILFIVSGLFVLGHLVRVADLACYGCGISKWELIVTILVFESAIGSMTLAGFPFFMSAYLNLKYTNHLHHLFNQLIEQGQLFEGEIIGLSGESGPQIIRYRFSVPAKGITHEGEYRLYLISKSLSIGRKVHVLYLNRCVHILL